MSAQNWLDTEEIACPECGETDFALSKGICYRVECRGCDWTAQIDLFDYDF